VPVDTDALGQLLDRAGEVAVLVVLRHAHLPALPYFGQAEVRRSAAGRVAFPSAVRSPGPRRLHSWCMTSASGPGIASVRARLMYERPIRGSASAIASLSLWTSLALRIGVGLSRSLNTAATWRSWRAPVDFNVVDRIACCRPQPGDLWARSVW